jgi:hypothetical protein
MMIGAASPDPTYPKIPHMQAFQLLYGNLQFVINLPTLTKDGKYPHPEWERVLRPHGSAVVA